MPENEVKAVKQAGGSMMLLGILQVLAGVIALFAPMATTVAIAWIGGAALTVIGGMSIYAAFKEKAGTMAVVSSGLLLVLGILLLMNPFIGASMLAIFVAVFFLLSGLMQLQIAFAMKPEKGWGWVLFGGILSVVLGVLLFAKWPLGGMIAVGVFIGIELIFRGMTILLFGSDLRSAAKAAAKEG